MPGKLMEIQGVEIFAAGKWNGDEYSEKDLDEMVRAFDETGKNFRPALKFGHDDNQTLLQRDGHPAAGWVGKLYRKGKKLLADFIDIPEKVYELLQQGAYKRVSSEVYWNAQVGGEKYSRLLGAVALLGADMPAVTCLSDIFQMYAKDAGELRCYDLEQKSFTIEIDKEDLNQQGAKEMDEKEKLRLEAEIEAEKKKNLTLEEKAKTDATELETLRAYKLEQDAKVIAAEKAAVDSALDATITELVSEKLVTPAMKGYVRALIGEERKEYSFGEGKEEKKFSKAGLLKEILKLNSIKKSTVNVDEGSVDGKIDNKAEGSEKAQHETIQKYATDNKVTYKEAYKALNKGLKKSDVEDSEDDEVSE